MQNATQSGLQEDSSNVLSATRTLSFFDPRPPHEIQFALELEFMALMEAGMESGQFIARGTANVNGAVCHSQLQFAAALPQTNAYTLHLTISWAGLPPESHAHHRNSSAGWFDLWTRNFRPTAAPSGGNSPERYARLASQSLAAESHLITVEAVQQEILAALRSGAIYSTAHKEGGTTISYQNGHFLHADYGESDRREELRDPTVFLAFLGEFYAWEIRRGAPNEELSDLTRWKLILRLLGPRFQATGGGASTKRNRKQWLWIILVAVILGGTVAYLRLGRYRADPPSAQDSINKTPPPYTPPPQIPQWKQPDVIR